MCLLDRLRCFLGVAHLTTESASDRARVAAAELRKAAAPSSSAPLVFDRRVKTEQARGVGETTRGATLKRTPSQRGRAAFLGHTSDPLQCEVAERLVERLEDCRRSFPTALVLGGAHHAVASRLGSGRAGVTALVHLDSSAEVLDSVRASQLPAGCSRELRLADEEELQLEPATFDVVIACLSLHWLNDLPGAMIQARRALRPDGLFLAAFFGGATLNELRIACAVGEQEREGGVSPRVSPLAQVRDAGNLLGRAGFVLPAVDTDTLTVRYRSAVDVAEHCRKMGENNAVTARRPSLRRDTALAAAVAYEALFSEGGTVPATWQVVYMTGWSPSENTPKALERGSATVSFRDLARMEAGEAEEPTQGQGEPVAPDHK